MKIRCMLVDDEPPALEVLQSHIANIKGLEVTAVCSNAIEALDLLQERPVDLIFLDIKLPKLMGIDFLKALPDAPKVIFVTAYREYAAESYELDAVDYLVKPVSFERFLKAIAKVKKILGHEVPEQHDEVYKKNLKAFVYLKVDRSMQKVLVNEILYIESVKDYVKVFLSPGSNRLVRQSISSMENLLSAYSFLRVHRSYLVSLDKITGYNSLSIQMGDKQIPIGRLYKQKVMDALQIR